MLLEITDGSVSRNGEPVLAHFSFEIRGTEKIALVGRNGAGKTTLLETIAGLLELDTNEKNPHSGLRWSRVCTVGMLRQQTAAESAKTVEELLLEAVFSDGVMKPGITAHNNEQHRTPDAEEDDSDGQRAFDIREQSLYKSGEFTAEESSYEDYSEERFAWEREFDVMLTRFGFSAQDKHRKLETFSGGEQRKILLVRLLLTQPDVLLLDEPTNHLDLESVQWLEDYLRKYRKAAIVISHDRYFIDQFADVLWEVSGHKLTRYAGNYTQFREQKRANYARQLKAYERQQEEIKREEELIERFKHRPRKAAFARSRRSKLRRMELVEKPEPDDAVIHTGEIVPARRGSKWVYECEDLIIGYRSSGGSIQELHSEKNKKSENNTNKDLVIGNEAPKTTDAIKKITFRIRRGQKIGVIGPNGSGKSTFLKTVAGLLPALKGKGVLGNNVDLAYFDQLSGEIRSDKSILEWFHARYPMLNEKEIRDLLAGYLFKGRDLVKTVSNLSGGEKARLVLASILQDRPNFLVLDEPTNNMDIPAMETLESIFQEYTGTILFVSHDRYFLSQVADCLLLFDADSLQVRYYPLGYDHYMERMGRVQTGKDPELLRSAEEQRLIEGLRSVPKGESHHLREVSTEQATRDWKFSLNRREREKAEEAYRQAAEKLEQSSQGRKEHQLEELGRKIEVRTQGTEQGFTDKQDLAAENYAIVSPSGEKGEICGTSTEALEVQKEKACAAWTQTLLDWYDLWLETQ